MPDQPATIKEVQMDVKEDSAKRRKGSRRRRQPKEAAADTVVTKSADTVVTKSADTVVTKDIHTKTPVPVKGPTVVLAPPKTKPAKIMLVPKGAKGVRAVPTKTFKAKRVRVMLDTAKTRKRRHAILRSIDEMKDEHVRAVAVSTGLSRPETVGKAPISLLRQTVKDFQTMREMV